MTAGELLSACIDQAPGYGQENWAVAPVLRSTLPQALPLPSNLLVGDVPGFTQKTLCLVLDDRRDEW